MTRLLLAGVLAVALTACGQQASRPDGADGPVPAWVEQPPARPGMLYGVGSGHPRKRAEVEAQARAAIAEQISVSVKSVLTSSETSRVQQQGSNRAEQYFARIQSEVETRAEQSELPGVTIVETTLARGQLHALAAFDRAAWAAQLRTRIAAIDADLTALAKDAGSDAVPAIARALKSAAPLLAERAATAARLRVADPNGDAPGKPALDRDAAVARLAGLLAGIRISMPAGADPALAAGLQEAVAKLGFTVVAAGAKADLALTAAITIRERDIPGFRRVDAGGSLTVTDPAGGKLLGSLDSSASGTHADPRLARDKAITNLAQAFTERIDAEIIDLVARR